MIVSPLLPLAEKRIRFSRFPASDVSSPAHTFARTRTLHRSSDGFFFRGHGRREVVYFYKSTRGRWRRRWRQTLQNYYYTRVDCARASECVCERGRGRRCRAVRRTLKIQPCQGQARTRARAPLVYYNIIIIMCARVTVLLRSLRCIFFFLFTIIVFITIIGTI